MRLVTKDIHYAIKSLLYFAAKPARVVSVDELVKKLNMRRAFLRKILQALSRHGILKSLKGYSGGFMLNLKADAIHITDVMDIFHGGKDTMGCLFEKDICPHPDQCPLMQEMKNIESRLNDVLGRLTIAGLLENMDAKVIKDRPCRKRRVFKRCA